MHFVLPHEHSLLVQQLSPITLTELSHNRCYGLRPLMLVLRSLLPFCCQCCQKGGSSDQYCILSSCYYLRLPDTSFEKRYSIKYKNSLWTYSNQDFITNYSLEKYSSSNSCKPVIIIFIINYTPCITKSLTFFYLIHRTTELSKVLSQISDLVNHDKPQTQ